MLTPEQLVLLEPLIKHERFGKLLIEAINTWKEAVPRKGSYGVFKNNSTGKYEFSHDPKDCCLIGASLHDKHMSWTDDYALNAINYYQITDVEMNNLIAGFDGEKLDNVNSNAYKFGKAVAEIVLC